MRKLFIHFLFLLLTVTSFAQDWKRFGVGSQRTFYMIDSVTYLIEKDSDIYKYTNGIQKKVYDSNTSLNDINDFSSNTNGVIFAAVSMYNSTAGRILKSMDDGESWTVMDVPLMDAPIVIHFVTKDLGFVGGTEQKIFRTTDGGLSWQLVHSGSYSAVRSIDFINEIEGFAVGGRATQSLSLKTIDGGESWTSWTSCGFDCEQVFFSSDSIGYVTSKDGLIRKNLSNDTSVELDVPEGVGYGPVYFLDDNNGYLVVRNNFIGVPHYYNEGEIYFTSNGGESWVLQTTPDTIAAPQKFYQLGNILYINAGNSSGETFEEILATEVDPLILSSIQKPSDNHQFIIYPNPSSDEIIVNGITDFHYRIISISGQLVFSGNCDDGRIDISDCIPGLYYLNLHTVKNCDTVKFIKI